jgi:predicted kinase
MPPSVSDPNMVPAPVLYLVMGLPASGKTTLARALADRTGALHLSSDALRAELCSRGRYDADTKEQVYQEMLGRARNALLNHRPVVADATFHLRARREPFLTLASELKVPCHLVEVQASDRTTLERLRHPRPDSEATWEVYRLLKASYEPPPPTTLKVPGDTLPVEQLVDEVLRKTTSSTP